MAKKLQEKKVQEYWAVLLWGEIQQIKHIFNYRIDAENFRKELIEEPQHCGTCECEGLDKSEIEVVSVEIHYQITKKIQ